MRQAVVIEAVRTPIARAHAEKGFYRDVRADDLSAQDLKYATVDDNVVLIDPTSMRVIDIIRSAGP